MGFVLEKPRTAPLDFNNQGVVAGGVATGGELLEASSQNMLYVDNTFASHAALEEAYDQKIDMILEATGRQLVNPLRDARMSDPDDAIFRGERMGFQKRAARLANAFDDSLAKIALEFPQLQSANNIANPIERDAEKIARDTDHQAAKFMASRTDFFGKWAAVLAGGIKGGLRDPVQVATMGLGFGPSTARTVAGRILQTTVREMAVNGSVEAAMQPFVQKWRKQAGLENGLQQAMANIGMGAMIGGAFGAAGRSAVEGVNFVFKPDQIKTLADEMARSGKMDDDMRAALGGDEQAAARVLEPVIEAMPDEARGAMAELEQQSHDVPANVNRELHETNVQAATSAMLSDEAPKFEIDDYQLGRLVNKEIALTPDAPKPEKGEPSLIEFIAGNGGVKDQKGELSFMDAAGMNVAFTGKLVKKNGRNLDAIREIAAEAGYLDSIYGNPTAAMAQSSRADLLDLIDQELRGQNVYPSTMAPERMIDLDQEATVIEAHYRDIMDAAGPGLSDDVYHDISNRMFEDGLSAGNAADQVIMALPISRIVDGDSKPLPGWSDEELLAASEQRTQEYGGGPRATEPGEEIVDFDPAEYPDFENVEVPGLDGELVTMADLNRQAGRDLELSKVLENCNVA